MTQQEGDLTHIGDIWAQTKSPPQAFAELSKCLQTKPGYKMLSVSRWNAETRYLHRVFSTDETAYPVGGKKLKPPSAWSDVVLKEMKPHLAPNMETIRLHFDDHKLLESLAIDAILNIPIVDGAICLGTMNLMNSHGSYNRSDIDRAVAAAEQIQAVLRTM